VSKRSRVYAIVGIAAAAAIGTVAAVVVVSGGDGRAASSPGTLKGRPPLELDLGVRVDPEAVALRHAGALYADGRVADAARIFGRYHSVDAEVGSALAAWPDGTVDSLGGLAAAHPRSSFVQLHLGLALYWARRQTQALSAWRAAKRANPDSYSAIRADDLLHPQYNRGLPTFVPSFSAPSSLAKLSPREQLAALAAGRGERMKLLYGIALQRLGHPLSARHAFDEAVRLAPNDPEAQVAAAVGRFDKSRPARAFSRLGPLSKRFPHASTVRFHLGLLLLWLGQVKEGKRQLRLAEAAEPGSPLAREAHLFLQRLK
jgi:tetratricopeptide (TPR) repeat protein